MRSKASFVRIQSVEEVRASLATYGGGIAERLQHRRPTSAGEGEALLTAINYQALFGDLEEDLGGAQLNLVTAEDKHLRSLIRVSKLRRQRDAFVLKAHERLVANRRVLLGVFGPDRGFELAALDGRTPRESKAMIDQLDQTIQLMRDPEGELPVVVADGVQLDFEGMATGFESDLADLRQVRGQLERANKAAAETLIAKDHAIKAFNGVFPPVAGILEGFFRLAGEPELAERVRTSTRRITRRQGATDDEEPSEGVTSGEASSDSEATNNGDSPSPAAEPVSPTSASAA